MNKAELYNTISKIRERLNIEKYPLDIIGFCDQSSRVSLAYVDFETNGLCSAAFPGKNCDTIVINKNHVDAQRAFDCAHEVMHLTFHRKLDRTLFSFENASSQQNPFYEWQANEGAAELLVPYKDFIPKYIEVAKRVRRVPTYKSDINDELAPIYGVTDYVINNRIKNLQYEIYQYKNGVPLDELVILSKRKQEEYGIFVDPTALCCNFCNAIALEADNFCHICGKEFIQQGWWDKTHPSRTRSVASMIYQGIDIDENGRMKKCSVCENEEITSGDFCMICGSNLINECENEECNCTAHLPGNARYCPQCGHETSFSKAGYLSKWNTEEQTIETDIYDEMMPF